MQHATSSEELNLGFGHASCMLLAGLSLLTSELSLAHSGANNANYTTLSTPDQLMEFTCGRLVCQRGDFVIICVIDSLLSLGAIACFFSVCYWMRGMVFCQHCGKLMAQRTLTRSHFCRLEPRYPCMICLKPVSEVCCPPPSAWLPTPPPPPPPVRCAVRC